MDSITLGTHDVLWGHYDQQFTGGKPVLTTKGWKLLAKAIGGE